MKLSLVYNLMAGLLYSDCQKDVPLYGRLFVTTTYAAIPYFGI